jgi:hypothetical protein
MNATIAMNDEASLSKSPSATVLRDVRITTVAVPAKIEVELRAEATTLTAKPGRASLVALIVLTHALRRLIPT